MLLQALFAGEDPDVPLGEKGAEEGRGSPGRRSGQKSGLTDRDPETDENWNKDDRARDRDHESSKAGGSTVAARFEDKDITDLKMVSNCFFDLYFYQVVPIITTGLLYIFTACRVEDHL